MYLSEEGQYNHDIIIKWNIEKNKKDIQENPKEKYGLIIMVIYEYRSQILYILISVSKCYKI